jgi:hypothetical protein
MFMAAAAAVVVVKGGAGAGGLYLRLETRKRVRRGEVYSSTHA